MAEEKTETTATEEPRFGFITNLRQKPAQVLTRVEFLVKIKVVNPRYVVMYRNLLIGLFTLLIVGGSFLWMLISDGKRGEYLTWPSLLIMAGIIVLLIQFMFIDPSSGPLLIGSFKLSRTLIKDLLLKLGRGSRLMDVKERVKKNGLIIFRDGQYGYAYLIDGNTSRTAFPKEIQAQISIGINYHKVRERTTSEIKITSTQMQDAKHQMNHYKTMMSKQKKNKAKYDYLDQLHYLVSTKIDGAQQTSVQWLILRNKSVKKLEDSLDKLADHTAKGLYYSLQALDKKETKKLLSEIRGLK